MEAQLIKNILDSDRNFAVLSDYLSPQERDRIAGVLEQALGMVEEAAGKAGSYEDWAKVVRPAVLGELNASASFFGFKDLARRFNTDSFLAEYYNTLPVGQ